MASFEKLKSSNRPRSSARRGRFVRNDDGVKEKLIEIWQYEIWSVSKGWSETRWADIQGVAAAATLSELPAPSGYTWSSDWQVSPPEAVKTKSKSTAAPWRGFDQEGWEYATNEEKFGIRPPRKGLAFDGARRRRWTRTSTKKRTEFSSAASDTTIDVQIKKDLEGIQRLRYKVEAKSRLAGTSLDSVEVRNEIQEFARQVQETAANISLQLDSIRRPAAATQKLQRDLSKEVTIVAGTLRSLPVLIESSAASDSNHQEDKHLKIVYSHPSSKTHPHFNGGGAVVASGHGSLPRQQQQQQQQLLIARETEQTSTARREQQQADDDSHILAGRIRTISENTVITRIETETSAAAKDVHDSILAINSLMKDLANQVEVQQDMIDSIEHNTTEAYVAVENAADQLQQAADIQAGKNSACLIS